MNSNRPKFLPSYLEIIAKEAKESGWLAVLPYCFITFGLVGAAVAWFLSSDFYSNSRWDVSTAVYAGILTLNGLLLVLGWNAFSRMYDVLLRIDFGIYLAKNNMLNSYIVHIHYMHVFQILSVLASAIGLVSILFDQVPLYIDRIIFGTALWLTLYAIKQASDAVTAMNDLVWQAAFFELNKPGQGAKVVSVR